MPGAFSSWYHRNCLGSRNFTKSTAPLPKNILMLEKHSFVDFSAHFLRFVLFLFALQSSLTTECCGKECCCFGKFSVADILALVDQVGLQYALLCWPAEFGHVEQVATEYTQGHRTRSCLAHCFLLSCVLFVRHGYVFLWRWLLMSSMASTRAVCTMCSAGHVSKKGEALALLQSRPFACAFM